MARKISGLSPLLASALLAPACAPQSAQLVEGDFTGFLSVSDSLTAFKGNIPVGEDAEGTWERYHTVDCRDFETAETPAENEQLRLPGRLQICRGDDGVGNADWPPRHETWLDGRGFHVFGETLDPWRGEAILTSEGDLQIGFHHRLPGGVDFRFIFVVNPNFQPRACVQREDGEGTELIDVDGDWVGNWSRGLNGGQRFYLNGASFMWDPIQAKENTSGQNPVQWFLPNWWLAGYGGGRIGDDDLRIRSARYARPELYLAAEEDELTGGPAVTFNDLLFCDVPDLPDCDANPSACEALLAGAEACTGQVNAASSITERIRSEYQLVRVPDAEGLPVFEPQVEDNRWRPFAPRDASSLSRWVEIHYNYVDFDEDIRGLEPGDSVSGTFHLILDALDSGNVMMVRGRFDVPRVRRDRWTTDYLPPILVERNETELCDGADDPSYFY